MEFLTGTAVQPIACPARSLDRAVVRAVGRGPTMSSRPHRAPWLTDTERSVKRAFVPSMPKTDIDNHPAPRCLLVADSGRADWG